MLQLVDVAVVLAMLEQSGVMLGGPPPPAIAGSAGDEPHHAGVKPPAPIRPELAAVQPASAHGIDREVVGSALRPSGAPGGRRSRTLAPAEASVRIDRRVAVRPREHLLSGSQRVGSYQWRLPASQTIIGVTQLMFLCAQDGGKIQSLDYLENKKDISYFSQTP